MSALQVSIKRTNAASLADNDKQSTGLRVRDLGLQEYVPVWQAMQRFTDQRHSDSADEIWLVEHHPVFTQGQAGKPEHILMPGQIPIVQSDRGGQATYHGPGQQMVYLLLDIERLGMGARELVRRMEQAIIDTIDEWGLHAHRRDNMPGVYVDNAKIASLGLRIRQGRTYHGLSFNVDMDLEPFERINPCGFQGLSMTQLRQHRPDATLNQVRQQLLTHIMAQLGYTNFEEVQQADSCLKNNT